MSYKQTIFRLLLSYAVMLLIWLAAKCFKYDLSGSALEAMIAVPAFFALGNLVRVFLARDASHHADLMQELEAADQAKRPSAANAPEAPVRD